MYFPLLFEVKKTGIAWYNGKMTSCSVRALCRMILPAPPQLWQAAAVPCQAHLQSGECSKMLRIVERFVKMSVKYPEPDISMTFK